MIKIHSWTQATVPPALEDGVVHLWRVALVAAADSHPWTDLLSDQDRADITGLKFARDRLRRTIGRGFRRYLLAGYSGVEPEALQIEADAMGRPRLVGKPGEGLEFSLSYGEGCAVLAVAWGARVGLDIQKRAACDAEGLMRGNFSAGEIAEWKALPAARRLEAFFAGWTRKEAYLKALGTGLWKNPASFTVTLDPARPAALVASDTDPNAADNWWMWSEEAEPDHCLALVVERNLPRRILRFQLP